MAAEKKGNSVSTETFKRWGKDNIFGVKTEVDAENGRTMVHFVWCKLGPFSIYEQPKYKPNLTITLILTLTLIQTLILILTQILTLKPTWVDATIRSHFGCSYIEKEP